MRRSRIKANPAAAHDNKETDAFIDAFAWQQGRERKNAAQCIRNQQRDLVTVPKVTIVRRLGIKIAFIKQEIFVRRDGSEQPRIARTCRLACGNALGAATNRERAQGLRAERAIPSTSSHIAAYK
ncbi:hypothetical protein [Methylorubrum aminovorans]|uniref:hypothetical protein n=1 Tax=Methylorubrum aminovorans TaxID=269069 RepID=UPI001EE0EB44|nr:hypothetical protein [Methylorubrum aminovorans]